MTELERPYIGRLVWDDWNRDHIAKHDVTPAELEEVVAGDSLVRANSFSWVQPWPDVCSW